MLQNPCKTLGFKKNMVYKIPPGGGGKPYPASGLYHPLERTMKLSDMKIERLFFPQYNCQRVYMQE